MNRTCPVCRARPRHGVTWCAACRAAWKKKAIPNNDPLFCMELTRWVAQRAWRYAERKAKEKDRKLQKQATKLARERFEQDMERERQKRDIG